MPAPHYVLMSPVDVAMSPVNALMFPVNAARSPVNARSRRPHSEQGFTLIEVLVALLVMASLSLGAYQVLQGVMRNDEVMRDRSERLATLQRVFNVMERDFSQITERTTRDNGETSTAVFTAAQFQLQSDDWSVAFVRNGWLNPSGQLPRSQLQRVAYRLRNNTLERLSYSYLDPAVGTEPTVTPLLDKVSAFRLRFYSSGQWVSTWSKPTTLPKGIEIQLTLDDYGDVRRVFLIAGSST